MDEAMRVELERIRDEDNRQNKRLEILEGAMEEMRTAQSPSMDWLEI